MQHSNGCPTLFFCPVLEGWVMAGSSENLPCLACLLLFRSSQRVVRMGRKGFMTVGKKSPKCSHASSSLHTTMLLHLVRKYKAIMPGRVTSYPYKLVPAKETWSLSIIEFRRYMVMFRENISLSASFCSAINTG